MTIGNLMLNRFARQSNRSLPDGRWSMVDARRPYDEPAIDAEQESGRRPGTSRESGNRCDQLAGIHRLCEMHFKPAAQGFCAVL